MTTNVIFAAASSSSRTLTMAMPPYAKVRDIFVTTLEARMEDTHGAGMARPQRLIASVMFEYPGMTPALAKEKGIAILRCQATALVVAAAVMATPSSENLKGFFSVLAEKMGKSMGHQAMAKVHTASREVVSLMGEGNTDHWMSDVVQEVVTLAGITVTWDGNMKRSASIMPEKLILIDRVFSDMLNHINGGQSFVTQLLALADA